VRVPDLPPSLLSKPNCASLLLAVAAHAQPTTFEVASVRPGTAPTNRNDPTRLIGCTGGPGTADPVRLRCNESLRDLIATAYQLKPYQFTLPDWMQSSRFEITANIPAGATEGQLRLMEQNLLAERFKLAVHFVKKEMQTYEMTVGKDGPKFKEWDDVLARTDGDAPLSGTPKSAADLRLWSRSDAVEFGGRGGRRSLRAKKSMDALAGWLSASFGRPVIDATGLTGEYDIMLDFVQEPPARPAFIPHDDGPAPEPPVLAAGPTLLNAVQSQLGLKLEPKKGIIDVLIVDHVERVPTDN
jgi:uncharacterized protein (TIGR03435 family)